MRLNHFFKFTIKFPPQAALITRLAITDHEFAACALSYLYIFKKVKLINRNRNCFVSSINFNNVQMISIISQLTETKPQNVYLSLFSCHVAYAFAWLSGIDIFTRTMYVDGTFNVLRSALTKGGIIFTDSQPFQHLLEPNAFKHKVVCVTRILHLRRFKTPCGPYNDVLSKLAAVLDPSSCVLALGTWQLPITWAINALRANAIPVAATVLSPLRSFPAYVWEDWVAAIERSPVKFYCIIFDPITGLDII
ncbi:MAG: hypothetical protein ACTS4Z_02470, partial [Candidatus Hodgkinia cicadicola]